MKKYHLSYESDYCDTFRERSGDCTIIADSEDMAIKEFYKTHRAKDVVIAINEER